jgi:hypothetical protein
MCGQIGRTKQRIGHDHPPGSNMPGPTLQPTLASANVTVVEGVPALDSETSCHLADNFAVDQDVNLCLLEERRARDQLAHRWGEFQSADRSHCTRYSSAGGGGTYTDLLTCLEMELYAKNLHAKNRSVANQ